MTFSLEFQPTIADIYRITSDRLSRIGLIVRRLIAGCLIVYGMYGLSVNGLNWVAGTSLLVAVMLWVPFYIFYLFFGIYLAIKKPILQISIDEECVCLKSKRQSENLPWSNFAMFGTAIEYKSHFWLEGGRSDVWIPKRAFHSAAELNSFRKFVSIKMGDRCQFDMTGEE